MNRTMNRHHQDQLACLIDQGQEYDTTIRKGLEEEDQYSDQHPDLYWRCGLCGDPVSVDGDWDEPCSCDRPSMDDHYWRGDECDD